MRASVVLLIASTGCSSVMADKDGRVFGEDLGRFHVAAALETSSCGAGALGTPDNWSFDIQLSREDAVLFWNQGGAAVEGDIGSDGVSFSLESETEVPVAPTEGAEPTCIMRRFDRASGRLDDSGYDVTGFSGELRYRFTTMPGTDCSPLVGVAGGFEELPCEIHFGVEAERNLAPQERR